MPPIGQTIYLWRRQKGLTQQVLAERSGVSRPNLSAIEQGGRDLTVQTLRRLASALGVNAGALVDGVTPASGYDKPSQNRYSLDRIARLSAGECLRASGQEKRIAHDLASVMKSKVGWKDVKKKRLRTTRREAETMMRLKSKLGSDLFSHLIRRAEKNLVVKRNAA